MKWTRGTKNTHVRDVRGRRPGAVITGGGLAGILLAIVVSNLLGVDLTGVLGVGGGPSGPSSSEAPPAGADPDAELLDYVKFVMKDIQDTFAAMYRAEGDDYRYATLYVFSQVIDTGCGRSSSAIGPFYCPADANAYIDLSFYRDLKARFGAPGDFAQAYVLAHEIGHHLQHLRRVDAAQARLGRDRTGNEHSVRVELQADCFAGIWARHAQGKDLLEVGDLEEALTAAAAIGDDRLQAQAGVEVAPETFTHGTSAQRVAWFRRGFEAGRFDACDTFSVASP